jgi:hypothetical protein
MSEDTTKNEDGAENEDATNTAPKRQRRRAAQPTVIHATLVRGELYVLKGKRFRKGTPVPVTAQEKHILQEQAFDVINVEGVSEPRPKFEFSTS